MNLISAERYKNAGVHCLKMRKTDELWVGMKKVILTEILFLKKKDKWH